jgi:hypothetical protein
VGVSLSLGSRRGLDFAWAAFLVLLLAADYFYGRRQVGFMSTNASTWFYREPEHRAYLIEERVNLTFWSNRIAAIHLDCTNEEPPFRMDGEWHGNPVTIEWVPNEYLTLTTLSVESADALLIGIKEILGFPPTISYVDPDNNFIAEWHVKEVAQRIQEIQGNPTYHQIKRYKK